MVKIKFHGGHIEIMLFTEIAKLKLTGGHNEIMLFIEMEKNRISCRPYWKYAIYKRSKT